MSINSFKTINLALQFIFSLLLCMKSFATEQPFIVLENSDPVSSIAFSSDGSKLIAGWGKSYIWDMDSGQKILTINSEGASCLSFSPDNKRVAIGSAPFNSGIWNAETGEKITSFNYNHVPGTGPIVFSTIAFHPREPYVITATSDGDLSKWDIFSGEETPLLRLGALIDRIYVFLGGDRIATYKNIISLRSNVILHEFDTRIQISSNENYVFCCNGIIDGNFNKHKISVYNVDNYRLEYQYPVFDSYSRNCVFSPEGSLILLSEFNNNDGPLQMMRVDNNKIVHNLKIEGKDNYVVSQAIFSPNGKNLAVVSEKKIYIWDISDLYSHVTDSENLNK